MDDLDTLLQSKKLAIISMICAVLFGISAFIYTNTKITNSFRRFRYNNIADEISEIEEVHSYIVVKLKHHKDTSYSFTQATQSYLKKDIFDIIQAGDSIYKPAFADSVSIIRNGVKTNYPIMYTGD
jgi:hypothetical protein